MTSLIPITVHEHAGAARAREVTGVSVPLPRGNSEVAAHWVVRSAEKEILPCQTKVLANWTDGSIKWLQVLFPATVNAHSSARFQLSQSKESVPESRDVVSVESFAENVKVNTGMCIVTLPRRGKLLANVRLAGEDLRRSAAVKATITSWQFDSHSLEIETLQLIEPGPLRAVIGFTGKFGRTGLECFGSWTLVVGSTLASLEVTVRNPMRARHPRGCWDLGDSGSVLFRELAVTSDLGDDAPAVIRWRTQSTSPWHTQTGGDFEIYQDSSGGENFSSRNHLNRLGEVPIRMRGYVVRSSAGEDHGLRSQPTCVMRQGNRWMAAVTPEFWQQFPKAISAKGSAITIGLFPRQSGDLHELQGGEQKTHRIGLQFGNSPTLPELGLEGVTSRLEATCGPEWTAATGAVDNLPRQKGRLRPEWLEVTRDAVEGKNSFFAKREIIDEFGWRHYGDLWADHEEAYYHGPKPLCSHYNNQYDALQGFLLCYLVSGDYRWRQLADSLARHVIDIDIYHTKHDRSVYNGGLFWHTNHYRSAETSSHRSYSRVNHDKGGGGPSSEHNYSSGLLLYYYLTGDCQAQDAVVGLADWVLNMDDGRRHILGLVLDGATGFASSTADPAYHGPGRGAGNSINTLLDGWMASGRAEFVRKAEILIHRSIHPQDDIKTRQLDNAELRWSYTVLLQALARCLAFGRESGLGDQILEYSRRCLLHYAAWMARHEVFYLDRPQDLEFPTETWAAQELRKANVLIAAARYADQSEEAKIMTKRAAEIYDRAWLSLMNFPSRTYTRPVVLAIQLGLVAASVADAPLPVGGNLPNAQSAVIPPSCSFVPQKEAVRRAGRSPIQLLAMMMKLGRFWRWREPLRSTWTAQRLRRFFGRS